MLNSLVFTSILTQPGLISYEMYESHTIQMNHAAWINHVNCLWWVEQWHLECCSDFAVRIILYKNMRCNHMHGSAE